MDEEIERLIISVRADTRSFASDVETMRRTLDGPLGEGLEKAGRRLEGALSRAIQTGKLGFDDLRSLALSVLNDIANAALKAGLDSLLGGSSAALGSQSGGLLGGLGSLFGSLFGAPGRATGGPVSPGRAYRVGERGPELFIPTSSGRVEASGGTAGGTSINVTIRLSDNGQNSAPDQLRRASRYIARDLRQIIERA